MTSSHVDEFFTTSDEAAVLELLPSVTDEKLEAYVDYPHAWVGLPREAEVTGRVARGKFTEGGEVVEHFVRAARGKQGVREKVEEIMRRRTEEEGGVLVLKR